MATTDKLTQAAIERGIFLAAGDVHLEDIPGTWVVRGATRAVYGGVYSVHRSLPLALRNVSKRKGRAAWDTLSVHFLPDVSVVDAVRRIENPDPRIMLEPDVHADGSVVYYGELLTVYIYARGLPQPNPLQLQREHDVRRWVETYRHRCAEYTAARKARHAELDALDREANNAIDNS